MMGALHFSSQVIAGAASGPWEHSNWDANPFLAFDFLPEGKTVVTTPHPQAPGSSCVNGAQGSPRRY